jgi:deoxyhypusine monooxygenase
MPAPVSEEQLREWGKTLKDPHQSLGERFKCLYGLRHAAEPLAIELIADCFGDESDLLKHELAYCLGQKQDIRAIPHLLKVLEDDNQAIIARHEAAEALGAIGSPDVIPTLEKFKDHSNQELRETCALAIGRIHWLESGSKEKTLSSESMTSVDPAPPFSDKNVAELKAILVDTNHSLFDRYRAMFTLRNKIANAEKFEDKAEAVAGLAAGLKCPDSALFRHEVAFVLGQVPHESAIPFLKESLKDTSENPIVRHESAEALGGIGNKESEEILKEFLTDSSRLVVESCVLALDIVDYTNDPKQFQYAKVPTEAH